MEWRIRNLAALHVMGKIHENKAQYSWQSRQNAAES